MISNTDETYGNKKNEFWACDDNMKEKNIKKGSLHLDLAKNGQKGPGLVQVIPHIPADSEEKNNLSEIW